jgi:FAD/FMN-containing dehydrogenase
MDTARLSSWGGVFHREGVARASPSTAQEAVRILRQTSPSPLIIVGAQHSMGRLLQPSARADALWMDLSALTEIRVDSIKRQVTVGPGVRVCELHEALIRHGLALENYGAIARQTVVGACQTNTHGSGTEGIACAVVRSVVVSTEGDVSVLHGSALACGMGRLGIVLELWITASRRRPRRP